MTSTSTSAHAEETRDMWRLHILDIETREMIVVECEREDIKKTVRSFDPLRYELDYIEDTQPAEILTTFCY